MVNAFRMSVPVTTEFLGIKVHVMSPCNRKIKGKKKRKKTTTKKLKATFLKFAIRFHHVILLDVSVSPAHLLILCGVQIRDFVTVL